MLIDSAISRSNGHDVIDSRSRQHTPLCATSTYFSWSGVTHIYAKARRVDRTRAVSVVRERDGGDAVNV
jgi:hypothetical protein